MLENDLNNNISRIDKVLDSEVLKDDIELLYNIERFRRTRLNKKLCKEVIVKLGAIKRTLELYRKEILSIELHINSLKEVDSKIQEKNNKNSKKFDFIFLIINCTLSFPIPIYLLNLLGFIQIKDSDGSDFIFILVIGVVLLPYSFMILVSITNVLRGFLLKSKISPLKTNKVYKTYNESLLYKSTKINNVFRKIIEELVEEQIASIDESENKNFIQKLDPFKFEHLIAKLLRHFNFQTRVTKKSGDHGVDIFIEKDGIKGIVQCKRFKGKISTPIIRDFIGTMQIHNVSTGYIFTSGEYSSNSFNLIQEGKYNIFLINIDGIVSMMRCMNSGDTKTNFEEIVDECHDKINELCLTAMANKKEAQENYNPRIRYKKRK